MMLINTHIIWINAIDFPRPTFFLSKNLVKIKFPTNLIVLLLLYWTLDVRCPHFDFQIIDIFI